MVPQILDTLEFQQRYTSPSDLSSRVAQKYQDSTQHYYSNDKIFINGVLKSGWRDLIVEIDKDGLERVNRVNYEISVLKL